MLRKHFLFTINFRQTRNVSSYAHIFNGGAPVFPLRKPTDTGKRGLFGVPRLNEPKDFRGLTYEVIQNINDHLNTLKSYQKKQVTPEIAREIISHLDKISESICDVVDVAGACRHIGQVKWLNDINEPYQQLHSLLNRLNTTPDLWIVSSNIIKEKKVFEGLNEEEKLVLTNLVHEFEMGGVHKSEIERETIVQQKDKISEKVMELDHLRNQNLPLDFQARMREIIGERNVLANLLGFKDFSELSMRGRVFFHTPSDVFEFLDYRNKELKKSEAKNSNTPKLAEALSNFNKNKSIFAEFMSFGNAMEGLQLIMRNLFDLNFELTAFSENERWVPEGSSSPIYRLEVSDSFKNLVGIIYFDPFERPGKITNPCTFSIKFSTEMNGWDVARVLVSLNFENRRRKSQEPPLLSFLDVQTLFHEFGHALHNLLSKSKYQHLAGVRQPIDFVEIPSTFLELFPSNYPFIQQFATHYKYSDVLPKDIHDQIIAVNEHQHIDVIRGDILQSSFDLAIHCNPDVDWKELANKLCKQYSIPFSPFYEEFYHLVEYGASYYTYLLSRSYSSAIWNKHFISDPLNSGAGEKYANHVLKGVKDPLGSLQTLLQLDKNTLYPK